MYDVIIIGAGPVGLFSTFYSALRGLKTLTLEKESRYGGQLVSIYPEKIISDLPGIKEIKAKDYINSLYEQYLPFKETNPIEYNIEVNNIVYNNSLYYIKTNKNTYITKTIIVASGNGNCLPRKLDIINASKCSNILYRLDNIEKYKNKNIAVLGGGDSAVDIANMLVPYSNVTLIHRRKEFRAQEENLEKFKNLKGSIITPTSIEKIEYDQICKALILKNIETNESIKLSTDFVFVNYGLLPSDNIFNNYLDCDACGILVNQNMETSKEGIYAVGNACSYLGKVKNITSGMGEVMTAITSIHQHIYPSKNPTFYSTLKK